MASSQPLMCCFSSVSWTSSCLEVVTKTSCFEAVTKSSWGRTGATSWVQGPPLPRPAAPTLPWAYHIPLDQLLVAQRRWHGFRFCKSAAMNLSPSSHLRGPLGPAAHSQTYPCLHLPQALPPRALRTPRAPGSHLLRRECPGTRPVRLQRALSLPRRAPGGPTCGAPAPGGPTCGAQVLHRVLQTVLLHRPQPLLGPWQPPLSRLYRNSPSEALLPPSRPRGAHMVAGTCLPPLHLPECLQLLLHVLPIQNLHVCTHKPREGAPSSCPGPPESTWPLASQG